MQLPTGDSSSIPTERQEWSPFWWSVCSESMVGINLYFACCGSGLFWEQYVVIISELAVVTSGVDVGWGRYSFFVILVLSREWGNVVSSRFPCLIPRVGRFLSPPWVIESQWVGRREERRVYFKCGVWYVLIVGCVECGLL